MFGTVLFSLTLLVGTAAEPSILVERAPTHVVDVASVEMVGTSTLEATRAGTRTAPKFAQAQVSTTDRLSRGVQLVEDLEYQEALYTFDAVIGAADVTPAQLLSAHMYAGICSRIIEKDVDARLHFSWVLRQNLNASLPAGQPPKVASFFRLLQEEARADAKRLEAMQRPEEVAPVVVVEREPEPEPKDASPRPFTPVESNSAVEEGPPLLLIGSAAAIGLGAVAILFGLSSHGIGFVLYLQALDARSASNTALLNESSLASHVAGASLVIAGSAIAALGGTFLIADAVLAE